MAWVGGRYAEIPLGSGCPDCPTFNDSIDTIDTNPTCTLDVSMCCS